MEKTTSSSLVSQPTWCQRTKLKRKEKQITQVNLNYHVKYATESREIRISQ
jgi:hypothetical protein